MQALLQRIGFAAAACAALFIAGCSTAPKGPLGPEAMRCLKTS